MVGLAVAFALGLGIGLLRGGSFGRLREARLHGMAFVFAGVAGQAGAGLASTTVGAGPALALTIAAYVAVFVFAFMNRRRIGMPLIALGSWANAIVIAANGGMPVSREAARVAGVENALATALRKGVHHPLDADSRLTFLADVIPVLRNVVSLGDLLIWTGIALLLQHFMVGAKGRHRSDPDLARHRSSL